MLFNSYAFLFCFLPILLLCWYGVSSFTTTALSLVLLIASAVFYGLWGLEFFLLLIIMVGLNYFAGLLLLKEDSEERGYLDGRISRKSFLAIILIINLLPLIWFKYSDFIISNIASLFELDINFTPPGLPLGISFYTFIQIAWIVGVYNRQIKPEGFTRHALFSACFPYVISGPIVRYEQIGPQFDSLSGLNANSIAKGFSLFALGLAKKVLIADSIAIYANAIFNGAEKGFPLTTLEAWLGSFAYTFQLYFDFSGYTDMAIGLGLMIGIKLPENFNSPYKSTGIVDFWRRWHITLGSWLKDFLYIPLGGNRGGKLKQYRNLFLTMLIGGAWHGAGWTFIIWGALHGFMLSINHYFRAKIKDTSLQKSLSTIYCRIFFIIITFLLINFCWVIFRAQTLSGAYTIYSAMFGQGTITDPSLYQNMQGLDLFIAKYLPHHYFQGWIPFGLFILCSIIVWVFPNCHTIFNGYKDGSSSFISFKPSKSWAYALSILVFITLILVSRKSTFLYFQF